MSDHTVTITLDGYPTHQFNCHAGAEAICRAVWKCECEMLYDVGIRNGVPAHRPDYEDPDTWHAGTFDATSCNLKDWFDSDDEPLRGTIEVDLVPEWQGDFYTFTVAPKGSS